MDDKSEQAVDFDLLLFDHVANQEPKLLNKMYSATQRAILEQKRVSDLKTHHCLNNCLFIVSVIL